MRSGTQLLPEVASTIAGRVDALYLFLVGLTAFFTVLIFAIFIFFMVKYRRRDPNSIGARIHGGMILEITWSIIPLFIVMGIFVWSTELYFTISRPPAETMNIYAVGKQWMWKFQHMDGQREINELHVPIGRNVKMIMTSEDVLHDLFFPTFRVKADVIPGRYTHIWFQATKAGTYPIYCAEYCGTKHSGMIGKVVVMEAEAYQAWLAVEERHLAHQLAFLHAANLDLFAALVIHQRRLALDDKIQRLAYLADVGDDVFLVKAHQLGIIKEDVDFLEGQGLAQILLVEKLAEGDLFRGHGQAP